MEHGKIRAIGGTSQRIDVNVIANKHVTGIKSISADHFLIGKERVYNDRGKAFIMYKYKVILNIKYKQPSVLDGLWLFLYNLIIKNDTTMGNIEYKVLSGIQVDGENREPGQIIEAKTAKMKKLMAKFAKAGQVEKVQKESAKDKKARLKAEAEDVKEADKVGEESSDETSEDEAPAPTQQKVKNPKKGKKRYRVLQGFEFPGQGNAYAQAGSVVDLTEKEFEALPESAVEVVK